MIDTTSQTQEVDLTIAPTRLLLGISGGIAAYKCADLVRKLKQQNFDVRVVMTAAAKEFITPMTLQAVSAHPVHSETFDPAMEAAMGHIELARWAEQILIAPATANTLAKICHGEADNLLLTLLLAANAEVSVAPAMNQQMWAQAVTQTNLNQLRARGITIFGPASGEQACGDVGFGRMLEPQELVEAMVTKAAVQKLRMQTDGTLSGKNVVITAGPTVEAIDPVRFISNHSSGKMGYALAAAAQQAGARVLLISGPVNLDVPNGVNRIAVQSAAEMLNAVKNNIEHCDIFIGCAAVADYAPVEQAEQKIKKDDDSMTLSLKRNPDILAWVAAQNKTPYVVGFAAESQNLKTYAQSKLNRKKLDLICANDISQSDIGFNSDNNQLLLLDKMGNECLLAKSSKDLLAVTIMQHISKQLNSA